MADCSVLHAVRLRGAATVEYVAARCELSADQAEELLLDYEAYGWVTRFTFLEDRVWSLTEAGRQEDERILADELHALGAEQLVRRAHSSFVPLNEQLLEAVTAWQLQGQSDSLVDDLAAIVRSVHPLLADLDEVLPRFAVYRPRLDQAVAMARAGRPEWVDAVDRDSVHRVWFELHEDLLATLGVQR